MQRGRTRNRVSSIAVSAALCGVAAAQPSPPVHGSAPGGGHPEIYVRFDNRSYAPTQGQDFDFDFSDPDAPGVALNVGQDNQGSLHEWRVWCRVSENDPTPATIGSITTPGAYDYFVKILNDAGGPGAANLGSAILVPEGDHWASLFGDSPTGSHISGDLTGNLLVKNDYGGAGGAADLLIEGSVGPNAVVHIASPGLLWVMGDMGGQLEVAGETFTENMAIITGPLTGSITIAADSIDGYLECDGGNGNIKAGRVDWGQILLGMDLARPFGGTAVFDSIGPVGQVQAKKLDGAIEVRGDVGGWYNHILAYYTGQDARIKIDGSLYTYDKRAAIVMVFEEAHPTSAITIDWDGWDEGADWDADASVVVGYNAYHANAPNGPDFVWLVSSCRCDMDNNGSVNTFDINGFVAALTSVDDYDALYPGLGGSAIYHADANCDGTMNIFDIEPFLARVADGCCACGGCGFFMAGGVGSGGLSAEDAGALLAANTDASFMGGLIQRVGELIDALAGAAADYWSDVRDYLEKAR